MVPGWETVIELFFVPIPFQFLRILLFNPHWNGLGLDMLGLVGESLEAKHPQPLFIANRGFDLGQGVDDAAGSAAVGGTGGGPAGPAWP